MRALKALQTSKDLQVSFHYSQIKEIKVLIFSLKFSFPFLSNPEALNKLDENLGKLHRRCILLQEVCSIESFFFDISWAARSRIRTSV